MKIQANTNPSAFFDNSQPYQPSKDDEIIEMETKDGVTFLPKPPLMISYRPLDTSGVIVEDGLPSSASSVSAKYEATLKLILKPKQGDILWLDV